MAEDTLTDLQKTMIYWYRIAIGVIIVIAASLAIIKVSYGSKNRFAYLIMCFAYLYSIYYIGYTALYKNETSCKDILYALEIILYLEHMAALQVWIFGICYWKSATACSF